MLKLKERKTKFMNFLYNWKVEIKKRKLNLWNLYIIQQKENLKNYEI
jgi:hypothetical protein